MTQQDWECYRFGPFVHEVKERALRRGSEAVPLSDKAFDLLLTLVRDAGQTVSKSQLMTTLWPDTVVEESNLTQTIFVLRKP
jgi:DNA-binding winged helix-turn-helix (wHTH) protein